MSTAEVAAPLFAALGDPVRLALVVRLADGRALSIAAMADGATITRQGVAKHLRVLEGAGLVTAARAGRETRYALCRGGVVEARGYLDGVAAQWDAALGRLKSLVERD